jgi:hypothetical protein
MELKWHNVIEEEAYNKEVIVSNGVNAFTPTMCYKGTELIKSGYTKYIEVSILLKLPS